MCLNTIIDNLKLKNTELIAKNNSLYKDKVLLLGNQCEEDPEISFNLDREYTMKSQISFVIKIESKNVLYDIVLGLDNSKIILFLRL